MESETIPITKEELQPISSSPNSKKYSDIYPEFLPRNFSDSNFFARFFYFWVKPAIDLANKRPLNIEDVGNISKDNKDDSDEDKTNLKEFSLLSLIMGNKKEKRNQNKAKSLKNSNEKFNKKKLIECWDNNLLKNVLPKYVKAKPNIKLKSTESRNRYNR